MVAANDIGGEGATALAAAVRENKSLMALRASRECGTVSVYVRALGSCACVQCTCISDEYTVTVHGTVIVRWC